ncbi:ABC transporter ATP-binding protein [Paenibacillus typhae]|uniref:ABC transporter ATP-binding protein n=1 Tax=Paenibacillus typhae TaxID=1174501 RepID=UPI0021ADDD93|nr:ABC transporter ATP-binding protein [Paenibacillus typhae]MBY0012332.1 ABC transporter ATP-binding protein [Paenibacillus typhae]
MMHCVLELEALGKKYRDVPALQNIGLSIAAGDIAAVIGKNGAGKTTLFKCITGQVFPTSGTITLYGKKEAAGVRQQRRKIGTMIEEPVFFPDFTARQNLEYFRQQRGIAGKEAIEQALRDVNLLDTGKKKFKAFSLGMKQRLGLALALMSHPELLILDEPTNGLDPEGKAEIRELLRTLNEERKVTILISSHILAELQSLATRYVFMDRGRIVEQLTAEELLHKTQRAVELVVDNSGKAATLLEQHFPDIPYRILPGNRIRLSGGTDRTEQLNRTLYSHGVGVRSIAVTGEDLEAYYLGLLGGGKHA